MPIDTESLASALSNQLRYGTPNNACWLTWVVFATEVGYDYSGAEYWHTFKERLPAWGEIDSNKSRSRISMWFRRFASAYNAVWPSGTWASQFRIIAWPITHAILPRDLQYQFAKSLHYNRYQIAVDKDPLVIGRLIHHRTAHASSRFREFCQQEELVGRIALALLGADTEDMPLSPEATRRIVGDLETRQEAREWLQEARADIRRIRGAWQQRVGRQPPEQRAPIMQPRFNLRPSLLLSQDNDVWCVGIQMPSFAPLAATRPEVAKYLLKTKVQFQGGTGDWQPARVLTIPSKLHRLERWPANGEILKFKDAFPPLEQLVRQETSLSGGPLWICRINSDRLAREMHSHQVRPGQRYIVLALKGHEFRSNPALKPIAVRCEGLTGAELTIPKHVPDDLMYALEMLGLHLSATVRIWPAGLPALSWDGEGHSEWLSTDTPCFGIDVDYDVAAIEATLDDVATLRIPRTGVQGPSWVQLPLLPPGQHRLVVQVKNSVNKGSNGVSRGEVILDVRNPLGFEETIHQRGGLMVIATPADSTIENLEHGDLRLEVFGQVGREANIFLQIDDSESDRKPFDKVVLPATLTDLWTRLPVEAQEDLGGSSACRLIVSADEIGKFTLPLERESRPLRWLLRRSTHTTTLRLVDEVGIGSYAQCQMAQLDQPNISRALDYDYCVDGVKVQSPGALFVVAGRECFDAVIVSQPGQQALHDLAQLAPTPRLDGFAVVPERVPSDVALLTLWSRARVIGPLGAARKAKVVRTMRGALARLVCGSLWMQAERTFDGSAKDVEAIAVLGDAISMRRDWQNFPAKLRMSHREAIEMPAAEVVSWLLAITTAFHICADSRLVERALRYLTDPSGFVASSRDVAADVQALAAHGELVRGARYLQILLEGKLWAWN